MYVLRLGIGSNDPFPSVRGCCEPMTSQAFSSAKTWRHVTSSTDTRLFPLPVLAWTLQRPAWGQLSFESTNAEGRAWQREWKRREKCTTEACVLVTHSRPDRRERGAWRGQNEVQCENRITRPSSGFWGRRTWYCGWNCKSEQWLTARTPHTCHHHQSDVARYPSRGRFINELHGNVQRSIRLIPLRHKQNIILLLGKGCY